MRFTAGALAAIRAAKARLEARQREADEARGRQPGSKRNPKGGQPYKRKYGEPEEKAQDNFTDPEGRIMKTSMQGFQQCYNAQATPTVTITSGAIPVGEGTNARFTLTRSAPYLGALTVNVSVTQTGHFIESANSCQAPEEVVFRATTADGNWSLSGAGQTTDDDGDFVVNFGTSFGHTVQVCGWWRLRERVWAFARQGRGDISAPFLEAGSCSGNGDPQLLTISPALQFHTEGD